MKSATSTTAARERPILFSDAMVRAILDGRKTQTRRPLGLDQFAASTTPGYDWTWRGQAPVRSLAQQKRHAGGCWQDVKHYALMALCPYGDPGDRLWVREAWCLEIDNDTARPTGRTLYRADGESVVLADGDGFTVHRKDGREASPWKPSIHMPRWASRLLLEVTAVRVERVQAITEEDALAEGVESRRDPGSDRVWYPGAAHPIKGVPKTFYSAREAFRSLWDAIYGAPKKGEPDLSWAASPWVWVVEFKRATGGVPS